MTANDSKSTPKKAERHPLALSNPYLMDGESEQEMLMHRAWQEGHDAALRAQAEAEARPQVVYAECADYRDGDVTLVGRVFPDGVRLGCQALEPWYATGVLIPPTHPAYMPAQQLLAALAQAQAQAGAGSEGGDPQ